jgi:hypothetical protein
MSFIFQWGVTDTVSASLAKPHLSLVTLWAIEPDSGSDFSFEARNPSRQRDR